MTKSGDILSHRAKPFMCPLYLCLFSSLFFCLLFCYSVFVLLLLCLYFLSFCLCSFVTLSLFSVLLSLFFCYSVFIFCPSVLFFCYSVFIFCPSVFVFPASKQKKDHRIFKEGSSISGDHLDIVKQELWATVLHRHLLQVFVHRAGAAVDRVVVLGIPAHGIC